MYFRQRTCIIFIRTTDVHSVFRKIPEKKNNAIVFVYHYGTAFARIRLFFFFYTRFFKPESTLVSFELFGSSPVFDTLTTAAFSSERFSAPGFPSSERKCPPRCRRVVRIRDRSTGLVKTSTRRRFMRSERSEHLQTADYVHFQSQRSDTRGVRETLGFFVFCFFFANKFRELFDLTSLMVVVGRGQCIYLVLNATLCMHVEILFLSSTDEIKRARLCG